MTIQNLDSIESYLSYVTLSSTAFICNKTATEYRRVLRRFVTWTQQTQQTDINEDISPTYRDYMIASGVAVNSAKKQMKLINRYVDWMVANNRGMVR